MYTVYCLLSTVCKVQASLRSEVYWLCRKQLNQIEREGWTKDGQMDGHTDRQNLKKSPVGQPLFGPAKRGVNMEPK